jgi:hypothetical protein
MPNINKSNPKLINKETGKEFEIPVEGSLGLLALGAVGLKAWRMKKSEDQNQKQK